MKATRQSETRLDPVPDAVPVLEATREEHASHQPTESARPSFAIRRRRLRRRFHRQIAAKESRSRRQQCGPSAQVALYRDFQPVSGGNAACRKRVGSLSPVRKGRSTHSHNDETAVPGKLAWRSLILTGCLVLAEASGVLAAEVSGPARVIDGDTLDIGTTRVRLFGIDAPESAQRCKDAKLAEWACGRSATRALEFSDQWYCRDLS